MSKVRTFDETLTKQLDAYIGSGYGNDEKRRSAKLAAYEALAACGMLTFSGAGISIPDRDPIVATKRSHDIEEINGLLGSGWRLLGGDVKDGAVTALLGRPKSVQVEGQDSR